MSGCAGPCSREFSCTFVACLRKVCAGNLWVYVLSQLGRLWPTGAAARVSMLDVWLIRVRATLPFREAVVREFLAPGPRATGLLVAPPGAGCLAVTQEDGLPAGLEADCRAGCDEHRSSAFARTPTGERDGGRVGGKGPAGGAAVGGPRVFSRLGDARDALRPAGCEASVGRRVRTVRGLADACCGRMARPAGSSGSDSDRMRSVASSRVLRLLASVRCGLRLLCSSRAEAR